MATQGSLDDKLAAHDFVTDFVWAARAVRSQPGVAVVSILLGCLLTLSASKGRPFRATDVVLLAVFVYSLGWDGVERMFFLYRREGRRVPLRELLAAAPTFMGRFLRLGFLAGIVVVPLAFLMAAVGWKANSASHPAAATLTAAAIIVSLDVALTFVTPALVFTTRSVREALRIGLTMIRRTWPSSGLYLLCPPLALTLLNTIYPTHIPVVRAATAAALALLALLAKGATAAYYLRARSVSEDAAAIVTAR
jgi:hypothetical protein